MDYTDAITADELDINAEIHAQHEELLQEEQAKTRVFADWWAKTQGSINNFVAQQATE